jgi:O-antigen/teichoic acid export membrane protein
MHNTSRWLKLICDVYCLGIRYLMAMGVMRPAMYASLLNCFILGVACWVLTSPQWGIDGGSEGLALAFVLTTYVGTVALVLTSWELKVRRLNLSKL